MEALCTLLMALTLASALILMPGCARSRDSEADQKEVVMLYEPEQYEMAESAVKGRIRTRLAQDQIELRGLWLGLEPVAGGPAELTADIDADASRAQAEEVSRIVAEVSLETLARHDEVQVRVFWWGEIEGVEAAQLAGAWTWDAGGELLRHMQPEELLESRREPRR